MMRDEYATRSEMFSSTNHRAIIASRTAAMLAVGRRLFAAAIIGFGVVAGAPAAEPERGGEGHLTGQLLVATANKAQ